MPGPTLLGQQINAFVGVQDDILIDTVPAGSTVVVGSKLVGQALPDGTYTCKIPLAGLTRKLTALLKATFAAGSCTTSGGSTMKDGVTVLTAFTGVAAMATTVRQTLSLTSPTGERFARLTIVLAGTTTTTFSEGEYYGN